MIVAAWLILTAAASAFAQNPTPVQSNVVTEQLTLAPANPVAPVTTVQFQPSIGGSSTLYYWFVSHDGSGNVGAPAGPFLSNFTSTPSASYPAKITFSFPAGVVSVDILRLSTAGPPSSACACAVATGVTISTFSDSVASTSAYIVATSASQLPAIYTSALAPALSPQQNDAIQFVSGNGNDSNNGLSWGSAKATIPGAVAGTACSNGCTIYVGESLASWAGGTFSPNVRLVFSGDQTVTLTGTVVFSRGDKLDCIPGESNSDSSNPLGGTVFSASGLSGTQDAVDLIGHSTSGSEIRGCSFEMNSVGRYGIYDSGSSNNIIEHVTVKDSVSDGVRVDNGNDHAYDLTFINDRVLHAGGAGFDFRTDNGTGDLDRITCMDCQYLPVDPGSSSTSGGPGIELFVPSGAASSQAIADFLCQNCHVGGTASGTDGILVEYAGTGGTTFFHKISFVNALSEDVFNGSNSAAAYHVVMPTSSNIQGLALLNADSGGVYAAAYNPNPPCDANAWGSSCWVQNETLGYLYENFTGNPSNGAPLIATQYAADVFNSVTVGGGSAVTSTGAGGTMTATISSGTATMTTAAIAAGACGTTVTVAASGVATTDAIAFSFNASVAANPGELTLNAWPTSGDVNFNYCNSTAASVTPSAATLNWRVVR